MDITKAEVRLAFVETKTEKVSLRLRIIHKRDSRRYALPIKEGVFMSRDDFDKLSRCFNGSYGKSAERIRLLYDSILPFINKARTIIDQLPTFTFEAFSERFHQQENQVEDLDRADLLVAITRKAEAMRKQGRIGNANNYEAAGKSLARYISSLSKDDRKELGLPTLPKKGFDTRLVLNYASVTPELLADYEKWMKTYGKSSPKPTGKPGPASSTTVGIYLRQVRSVFNDAIEEGIISQQAYPFGKKRFIIPAGKNTKKALEMVDIKKIMAYECAPGMERRSRDLWVLSYLSNGMNFADLLHLRWRDIDKQASKIVFIRKKTARTRKGDMQKIQVLLREESWAIIDRWKNQDTRAEAFVFPFIDDTMTPTRQQAVVRQVIKVTNKHMNRIAEAVGVKGDVNTYAARHSFATILLRLEAPIAFISQSLGHANIATTEAYLGSFDDEQTKKYLDKLL